MRTKAGIVNTGNKFLFWLLFIEGASLMVVELSGAKLLSSFYGNSLFVWTAVLSITILGLTLGYATGGWMSATWASEKLLVIILGIAGLWVWLMPFIAHRAIDLTSGFLLISGVITATFLLLLVPMFCFGTVGPFVVQLLSETRDEAAGNSGMVYFTSTSGGVAGTFLFGFYVIPLLGLMVTTGITAMLLLSIPFVYVLKQTLRSNNVQSALLEQETAELETPGRLTTKRPNGQQRPATWFLGYVLLEGGAVMALELMVARMLAPYFGSSLYVWAMVMGITLLSLAVGYYIGGKVKETYMGIRSVHWILLLASLFIVSMHFTAQQGIAAVHQLSLHTALPLVACMLLFPPLVLLGMVPTWVIRYGSGLTETEGNLTGVVFTLSSISGIATLLLCGLWIIPVFGLTVPSICVGFLVGVVPFAVLIFQQKYVSLLFVFLLVISLSQRNLAVASPDVTLLHFSEGVLGQVIVADVHKNGKGEVRNDRMLFVNRIGQTERDNNTGAFNWNYITFASAVASKLPEKSNALLLGLGGGAVADMLHRQLNFTVDAVELDARIVQIARKYFSLSPRVQVFTDDARHYLETTNEQYDLIFYDVFKGDLPPPHVLSVESFSSAKKLLSNEGMVILNFNGFLDGEIGKPGRSVLHTLEAAGFHVNILATPGSAEKRNTLFIATKTPTSFEQVRAPLLYKGNPVRIDSLCRLHDGVRLQEAAVFTDDQPSLEQLNILAADNWRNVYNKTYTAFFSENGIPLFK